MHLIPVSITYERLFEIRNLATEIVSGSYEKLSFRQLLSMAKSFSGQKLGKVYINFGETFDMKQYIEQQNLAPLTKLNLDTVSLRLTNDLVLEQEMVSPVVLNQIVASLLLVEPGSTVDLQKLFKSC